MLYICDLFSINHGVEIDLPEYFSVNVFLSILYFEYLFKDNHYSHEYILQNLLK